MTLSVKVKCDVPLFEGQPATCSCGRSWVTTREAVMARYRAERSPSLCPACMEGEEAKVKVDSALRHRCRCTGCWGHDGRCNARTNRGPKLCRTCGQFEEPGRKFEGGMVPCVRCLVGVVGRRLHCAWCELEVGA